MTLKEPPHADATKASATGSRSKNRSSKVAAAEQQYSTATSRRENPYDKAESFPPEDVSYWRGATIGVARHTLERLLFGPGMLDCKETLPAGR